MNDSNRSWIPCKPTISETQCNLFASSLLDLFDFVKHCVDINDGRCLNDKGFASSVDLPARGPIKSTLTSAKG
jgi:hypothetical protein